MTSDSRIPKAELAEIIASQAAGYRRIHDIKSGRNRIAEQARLENWTDEQEEAATALFDLQYGSLWGRNKPRLQRVVLKALERRDAKFFQALSRAYKNCPTSIWQKTNRIERFLLSNWTEAIGSWPALCLLTDADLTEVCAQELDHPALTMAAVIKTRQRLKLLSSTIKLTLVRRKGQIVRFEESKVVDKGKS